MSYKSLLKHRCTVLRNEVNLDSGSPDYGWQPVAQGVPCLLDLNFVRRGKDPIWTAEAGRPAERSGVLFVRLDAPLKDGDWVKITRGPKGTYSFTGPLDEAWRPTDLHHVEIGVREVPRQAVRGAPGAPLPPDVSVPVPDAAQAIRDQLSGIPGAGD